MEAKKKAVSTSVETKRFVLDVLKMIGDKDRYFFGKFMERFRELNGKHQEGFIKFMAERYEQKKWKDLSDDTTMYNDIIRSILFHFSGREDIGQPSKKELAHALREYIDSHFFKDAEDGEHETFAAAIESA